MMRIISAVLASIQQGLKTALDKIMGIGAGLVALPFQVFGLGITGSTLPEQPPEFRAPVAAADLVADLVSGPEPTAKIRDLDREGVNTIFKLAKMTNAQRAEADLSAIERDDVRALVLQMTQSELDALTKAGPGAVRRLIVSGDSREWGVRTVIPEAILPPSDTELAMKLRAVTAAMAKASGSRPFTMPKMPTL